MPQTIIQKCFRKKNPLTISERFIMKLIRPKSGFDSLKLITHQLQFINAAILLGPIQRRFINKGRPFLVEDC